MAVKNLGLISDDSLDFAGGPDAAVKFTKQLIPRGVDASFPAAAPMSSALDSDLPAPSATMQQMRAQAAPDMSFPSAGYDPYNVSDADLPGPGWDIQQMRAQAAPGVGDAPPGLFGPTGQLAALGKALGPKANAQDTMPKPVQFSPLQMPGAPQAHPAGGSPSLQTYLQNLALRKVPGI